MAGLLFRVHQKCRCNFVEQTNDDVPPLHPEGHYEEFHVRKAQHEYRCGWCQESIEGGTLYVDNRNPALGSNSRFHMECIYDYLDFNKEEDWVKRLERVGT